MKIIIQAICFK